jgi:hypothetical protein
MRFVSRFLLAWVAGFAAAVALILLIGRSGEDTDPAFVAIWAAIISVPIGLVTVLPLALLAWRRRISSRLVLLGGILAGSLPGVLPYIGSIWGNSRSGDPVYLLAAILGAVVGALLFSRALRQRWQAA